jgi:Do/DeqQ family serine protease
MKIKQVLFTIGISAITALGVIWGYGKWAKNNNTYAGQEKGTLPSNYKYAGFFDGDAPPGQTADFTAPSAAAIPAVVHIKTKTNAKQVTNSLPKRNMPNNPFSDFFGDDDFFNQFFGNRKGVIPEQRASGSGVIISDDGYIVTNNHVVENADEVTITLSNKKTYKAKVIGTDPSYDLAVLKVEAAGLPFLVYGNSDDVKIGQWVLAIGYPLNLETTVTAGIVSAKSRSLGLNKDKSGSNAGGVESFIQTDAAVNMGNSGGALISTDAKLIGINSAIASPTGYYSGYSYAIPVNIVKKVVDDLIKFGTVQRGFLGIEYVDESKLTEDQLKGLGIPNNHEGVYTRSVPTDGAAYAAGIRKGDLITEINKVKISSPAEMQGIISEFKPGDKVNVTYVRNGKENVTTVTLKNKSGNFDVVKTDAALDALGGEFVTLDAKKSKEYGVAGGVVVKKINTNSGALNDQTRMKDGFVILKVNDVDVKSVDDLKKQIGTNKSITISGFYPGYDGVYVYPLTLEGE